MDTRKVIIDRITEGMRVKGINSEAALARLAKVDQKTIHNIMTPETFVGSPKVDTLEKIGKAIGVSVSEILTPMKPAIAEEPHQPQEFPRVSEEKSTYGNPEAMKMAERIAALPPLLRSPVIETLEAMERVAATLAAGADSEHDPRKETLIALLEEQYHLAQKKSGKAKARTKKSA